MANGKKKTAGIPNTFLIIGGAAAMAGVAFYLYRKKSVRQAARARAWRRAALARSRF